MLLAEDPLFPRLPEGLRGKAVRYGLEAGYSTARALAAELGNNDPFLAAQRLGVEVTSTDREAHVGCRVHYSEYSSSPPTILLYRKSLDEVNQAIREHGLESLLGVSDVAPVHAAHELYHHLETRRKPTPTAGFRFTTFRWGPIQLKSGLSSLSEIAANGFAEEWLKLPSPPKLLEYVTLFLHHPALAWQMVQRLESLAEVPAA